MSRAESDMRRSSMYWETTMSSLTGSTAPLLLIESLRGFTGRIEGSKPAAKSYRRCSDYGLPYVAHGTSTTVAAASPARLAGGAHGVWGAGGSIPLSRSAQHTKLARLRLRTTRLWSVEGGPRAAGSDVWAVYDPVPPRPRPTTVDAA